MEFKSDLITFEGVYKSFMTEKLNIPTSEGRRTILANHMELMIPITPGIIETLENNHLKHYAINDAVLYFKDNVAEIVADVIIDVEDIDVEKAKQELEHAQNILKKARRENEKIRLEHRLKVAEMFYNAAINKDSINI